MLFLLGYMPWLVSFHQKISYCIFLPKCILGNPCGTLGGKYPSQSTQRDQVCVTSATSPAESPATDAARVMIAALLLATCLAAATPSAPTIVHIIPHSHEDPGWLLTSDQYYEQRSKAIITNVVLSLEKKPLRKFHYVEQVYFRRWWLAQNASKQASVRTLVNEKRLMFMTGGLCMNDEATTHHAAIVDQMTWGHRFLNETFGPDALPTVSWQIDAFGHSAGYAKLAQRMGLTSMIGQKVDFQEQDAREAARALEFTWTPDAQSAPEETMLGHLMWDNTQGAMLCANTAGYAVSCRRPARYPRYPLRPPFCRVLVQAAAEVWGQYRSPRGELQHATAPFDELHGRAAGRKRVLQGKVRRQLRLVRDRDRSGAHCRASPKDSREVHPQREARVLCIRNGLLLSRCAEAVREYGDVHGSDQRRAA